MKIHFLINSLVAGGAERVLILLANYFDKKKHEVTIITFNDPEDFKANGTIKRIRLHEGKIKNHTIRGIVSLSGFYRNKNNRPDILIPFITRTNLIAIIVGKIRGIKVISSEHNNHLVKTDLISDFTRKHLYSFSNALTVLTHFDYEFYKKRGVNVTIMPNPSTFNIFNETSRNRKKTILAVGDLNRYHHKGFDNLIPIVSSVLQKNKDWNLKIVGGGSEGMQHIKDLASKYKITEQVIFEGYSSNVAEIMKESDIYIMTSRYEGLPMVLLEAMSQGMACISYDCITGPSDIIDNDINGLLVEDQNKDAMIEKLNILISSPELRLKLAQNAINSLDRFDIDSIYEKYFIIFQNILKR